MAFCEALRVAMVSAFGVDIRQRLLCCNGPSWPAVRRHAAFVKFGGQLRDVLADRRKTLVPVAFGWRRLLCCPSRHRHRPEWNLERAVAPADIGAGGGDFLASPSGAVAIVATGLVRAAHADHGLAADHHRRRCWSGFGNRGVECGEIVAVDVRG